MEYNFQDIETRWQERWAKEKPFAAHKESNLPKFYVLDMFPYPSGAGLHVGHPLGYIASDIFARYKRHKGFNVLHPMGYDSFGLPAEQYAIQTGQHPAITTEHNINRYREQLDKIGFSFDWDREVRTSSPEYYRWTQWIFIQLFNAWYNTTADQAEPIDKLINHFALHGSAGITAVSAEHEPFTADQWSAFSEAEKEAMLQNYRLAYRSESVVNWCPALGTVLANDEVKDGFSERGGHPVIQKKMMQWSMRISAYADRLLQGLDTINWSESIKDSQRNWIGKSKGAQVFFPLADQSGSIEVFTTRPDTIFGVSFMVLAPEHELVSSLTTSDQKAEVDAYVLQASRKTERDRMTDVKHVTGAFTGAYAKHPFTGERIPIWIADYVLAGYGTGAVMAVPGHDSRDHAFAKHFNLPIKEVVAGGDVQAEAFEAKTGTLVNSEFLNGLDVPEAIAKAISTIEEQKVGAGRTNFRLRDAVFGRQRYWGEPIPVYYDNGVPKPVKEEHLPLQLPEVDQFLPTEDGEPPLGRAKTWNYHPEKGVVSAPEGYPLELTTMPGWAGSSWYWLRYMDPKNNAQAFGKTSEKYWQGVDLYIGGSEHATGHLLYSRFWQKALKDLGYTTLEEPFKQLINQGMIQGVSAFAYRHKRTHAFISAGLVTNPDEVTPIHVDISLLQEDYLDLEAFKSWREEYAHAEFVLENGKYRCGREVEKMSKSKYNVVNPDEVVERYGADTLRMYEMFLGPLEQSKPWSTQGISGVHNFLRRFWRLFHPGGSFSVSSAEPTPGELKSLHKTIKKVSEDIEAFSMNTAVSAFMICVNELTEVQCNKRSILEPLVVLLSPFAPHLAEELWSALGHKGGISRVEYPQHNNQYLVENSFNYPVSFNGKTRFQLELPIDWDVKAVEKAVMAHEKTHHYLEGKAPKKVIVVPKRIVNVVV